MIAVPASRKRWAFPFLHAARAADLRSRPVRLQQTCDILRGSHKWHEVSGRLLLLQLASAGHWSSGTAYRQGYESHLCQPEATHFESIDASKVMAKTRVRGVRNGQVRKAWGQVS